MKCYVWAIWSFGAVAVAGWLGSSSHGLLVTQACAVAWLALSGAAVHVGLRRTAMGELGWDGQHWRWEPAAGRQRFPEGELAVSLDLQGLVLVAFRSVGRPVVWLWLDRGAAPASWHVLRCALYGRPVAGRGASSSAVMAP